MRKYQNIENKKLMLKLEKPRLLHILSNNKFHYKAPNINKKYIKNTSFSPLINTGTNKNNNLNNLVNVKINNNSPIKTMNNNKVKENNIVRTTPLKFQYKKIPFEKVKGFKIKFPNNILNNNNKNNNTNYKKNSHQNYYPKIYSHTHSTIQANNNITKEKHIKRSYSYLTNNNAHQKTKLNSNNNTINTNLNTIQEKKNNDNIIKKPLQHLLETKSSSIGSKLETREESGHYVKSKIKSGYTQVLNNNIHFIKYNNNSKQKNFSFLKFDNLNHKLKVTSKKKILKYLDKTIKQLTKIKTIILDEKDNEEYKEDKDNKIYNKDNNVNESEDEEEDVKIKEEIQNTFIKIDLSKIGKNLEKYKNKIDIDKNTINISFEGNNKQILPYNYNALNKRGNRYSLQKINKTITYDELKSNVKEKQKLLQMETKSFKNFKKLNIHKRNKSENKYNTLSTYTGDYLNYKYNYKNNDNNYRIKNYDTEIKIPKLNINFNGKNKNKNIELNKINEEDYSLNNNKLNERYNVDNEADNNADIANFEFSD